MTEYSNQNLLKIIESLLQKRKEGQYWDFKLCYYHNNADMLLDILCMSNAIHKGDKYIVFGISDDYQVVGVEKDPYRKKQADIIDFLKTKKFAGGNIPDVELYTILLDGKEVDVLVIKASRNVPFYLSEEYSDKSKTVHCGIYSRNGDTNTGRNRAAEMHVVEKLFRLRFGLDENPFQRLRLLLSEPIENWAFDLDKEQSAYHKQFPEFQIKIVKEKEDSGEKLYEPFCAFYTDPSLSVASLRIYYHSTILYKTEFWVCDGGHVEIPQANIGYVGGTYDGIRVDYYYLYYELDSINGQLLRLVTGVNYDYTGKGEPRIHFLLFANGEERQSFERYLEQNVREIEKMSTSEYSYIIKQDEEKNKRRMKAKGMIQIYRMYEKWIKEKERSSICTK